MVHHYVKHDSMNIVEVYLEAYHHKDPLFTCRESLKLSQSLIAFSNFTKYCVLDSINAINPTAKITYENILWKWFFKHTWPSRWGASPRSIENEDAALFGSEYLKTNAKCDARISYQIQVFAEVKEIFNWKVTVTVREAKSHWLNLRLHIFP